MTDAPVTPRMLNHPDPSEPLHQPHHGKHTDYACGLSGPHCWACYEPWPCRTSRGIEREAVEIDVERLAAALDVLSDDGGEYSLMAPEEREDRDDAAERLAAEYARLSQPKEPSDR